MNEDIAKPRRSTNWFINRGAAAAFVGYFIGWIVLQLFDSKRPDGRWVLFGKSSGLMYAWPFISFPFIVGTLVICGAVIGWLMARLNERRWLTKWSGLVIGMILGAVLSMTAAAVVARIFDHWALTEYQLNFIHGYFFVKIAAVIGATSGAIAGAYTGISISKG